MTKSNQILAVLGCGWLGFPLAKRLVAQGYTVKGSTTTLDKLPQLEKEGIQAYPIALSAVASELDTLTIETFLKNVHQLIINIPPKLRTTPTENFVAKIEHLLPFIKKAGISRVIFVSSTSVYADLEGFPVITEKNEPNPDTEGGKQLWTTEQVLQNQTEFQTTVIRFGGLIGADRHPSKHLAGRKNVENPNAPINLVHLEDCLAVLEKVVTNENTNGQTYNVVAPFHPSRQDYYTNKAKAMNLEAPEFVENQTQVGKIIDASLICTTLDFTFDEKLYK